MAEEQLGGVEPIYLTLEDVLELHGLIIGCAGCTRCALSGASGSRDFRRARVRRRLLQPYSLPFWSWGCEVPWLRWRGALGCAGDASLRQPQR